MQARAGWAVGWTKEAFFGRDALLAEKAAGPVRSLRGLVAVDRGVLRPHQSVLGPDGNPVGETTSGTFSPTLGKGIALALIDTAAGVEDGDRLAVDVRGRAPGRGRRAAAVRAQPHQVAMPPLSRPASARINFYPPVTDVTGGNNVILVVEVDPRLAW